MNEWNNSLGVEYDALSSIADWPSLTPEHRRQCFVSLRAFVESKGDWALFTRTWPSMIAVRGYHLSKGGDGGIKAGYGRTYDQ